MLGSLPNDALMVIDAKATGRKFDVSWSNLRPLIEYVNRQRQRQMGAVPVYGALVVSSGFKQSDADIKELMSRFAAETNGIILSCLTASTLGQAVTLMKTEIDLRTAMRWKSVFAGGLISIERLRKEIEEARSERYDGRTV